MAQTKRRCVFCGEATKPLTDEHVWPRWLGNILGNDLQFFGHETRERDVARPQRRLWRAPTLDTKVRRVCAECNSTWMSDIETAARPILTPLIVGQEAELSQGDQEIAATWGFKTTLMLQFTHPARVAIPEGQYKEFFERRIPPSAVRISLGQYSGLLTDGTYWASALGVEAPGSTHSPESPNAFLVTFNVGRLVYSGYGRPDASALTFEGRSHFVEVWPASCGSVAWPPPNSLTSAEMRALHP